MTNVGSDENCPICRERATLQRQLFVIKGATGPIIFDISHAKQIARDGRLPVLIRAGMVERFLSINNWEEQHLAHVDVEQPGIVGKRYGALILLDGTHRAVVLHRQVKEFSAYMLTALETEECVVNAQPETPSSVAAEIRAVLANNPWPVLEVELSVNPGEVAAQKETAIRAELTPRENRLVELLFINKKRPMGAV